MPECWSQTATNVVVSKYFRGHVGTPERETSIRQLIGRVTDTVTQWGLEDDQLQRSTIQNPRKLLDLMGLYLRWPNPIQATVRVGGPFNAHPRLPFQLAELLSRTLQLMVRLPTLLRSS